MYPISALISMAGVYIGTSGWVYSDWWGKFYPSDLPERKWLEFYSQNFRTVEINSTFYHQMKPTTFANWAKSVPGDFLFAVKASRFITHIKRLKAPKSSLVTFFDSVGQLGVKLGPILLQSPPRFGADEKRLEGFLQTANSLQQTVSGKRSAIRLAFEFRDPSWFDESIYQVLRKHNAALVIAESGGHWPQEEIITADFTYLRFHGEGGSYATKYTDEELKEWAKKIKKWQKMGVDVYVYFNNDVNAFAVENAQTLIGMCSV